MARQWRSWQQSEDLFFKQVISTMHIMTKDVFVDNSKPFKYYKSHMMTQHLKDIEQFCFGFVWKLKRRFVPFIWPRPRL